jgi:nifR3 family TIM-barrel protein
MSQNLFTHKAKPIRLGKISLPNAIFYAPLAGCSDYPFRQMSAKFSPGLHYCEMVKMEAIVRRDQATLGMLEYNASMRPIGAQLCGSNPAIAAEAARYVASLGFDVIDFNCGCPVDKVTKDGSGSAMLKTPEKIGDIIAEMVSAVDIPVTVKVRAGWDSNDINSPRVVEIAEAAGASAIAVHGRTRAQGYTGPANWDYIKACKEAAKTIPVIGNGDLFEPETAEKMFAYTGCDIVLVARGTMGQPWMAEDIARCLLGEKLPERNLEWARSMLLQHFYHIVDYRKDNEKKALLDMRRVGCWYIKKAKRAREFRLKMSTAGALADVEELIKTYPLIPAEGQEPFEAETC